ncbi:MAG: hypothetical protein EWV67_05565 [Microcystis sp. M_QC_C_20170808_M2Col]|nr:MAG: hypothetical protein EWV67_05565 [Microcystis sp. M_QC_C_20170808_M2Col]
MMISSLLSAFHYTVSREAQLLVGWVSGSVNYAGVGFHASTQPTFCLSLYYISDIVNTLSFIKSAIT